MWRSECLEELVFGGASVCSVILPLQMKKYIPLPHYGTMQLSLGRESSKSLEKSTCMEM